MFEMKWPTFSNQFCKSRRCKSLIKSRLIPGRGLMSHLKGAVRLCCLLHQRQKRREFRETHKIAAPGRKYLPSSGNSLLGFSDFKRGQDCSDWRPESAEGHVAARTDSKEEEEEKNQPWKMVLRNLRKMYRLPKPKTISRGSLISLLRAPFLMKRSGLKDSASG